MREVDEKICKKINFKKEKTVRKKTLNPEATQQEQPIPLSSRIQVRSSTYSFITKLYKFLFFDETKLEWVFDSDLFNNFASDKKINIESSRTPLIFYFNSNEDDLVKINSHFIMGLFIFQKINKTNHLFILQSHSFTFSYPKFAMFLSASTMKHSSNTKLKLLMML
ncbi:hypothetical protein M9Y10_038889 [Tritrichomonas musculus]|uniref:Uncharacterized protein n=1 Tax=Tritrichomonas musculus TaxID=1915356 RepID=A0ABR2KAA0_9EUKA